ncbi:MAG: PrsW family intramembrane metalloprotease [Coriobacteriia bacterium]
MVKKTRATVRSRRTILLIVAMVLIGALSLVSAVLSAGVAGAAVAILAATLPALLVALVVLLFDRYEPEPRGLLALTFAYGATGAVLIAALGEGAASIALRATSATLLQVAVIAPVIEEIAKGLAVLVVMRHLRDEFNGIVDGIVYAVMVGSGFAFAENIVYYINALAHGQQQFAATVIVRGGFSAFAHPLFTSLFGIGLAIAAQRRRPGRAWPAIMGLLGAMVLHGIWNASSSLGDGFILVYLGIYLPLLAVVIGVVWRASRQQARTIAYFLTADVQAGLLSDDELSEMTSLRRRRLVLRAAKERGGVPALEARRAFQHAAAQLAFARCRTYPQAPARADEMRWVRQIANYKRAVNPAWVAPAGIEEPVAET